MGKFDIMAIKAHFVQAASFNRPAIVLASLATIASFAMFALQQYSGEITRLLELSPTNPWGFFTSIFLHRSWEHLSGNLMAIWLWTFYILLPPSLLSDNDKRKRGRFFIPAVMGAAMASSVAWVVALNLLGNGDDYSSVGASGLAYAFSGATLGLVLMNANDAFTKLRARDTPKKKIRAVLLINGVIVAMILFMVQSNPSGFLSVGPGVNSFVHAFGFLIAFSLIMGREYWVPLKRWAATLR